ncbi:hypothetical protein LTR50_007679 [Elasticomyces elasticus]|nr:hypothetical protein LTR50_007679 [Elasticomyces elasticus]
MSRQQNSAPNPNLGKGLGQNTTLGLVPNMAPAESHVGDAPSVAGASAVPFQQSSIDAQQVLTQYTAQQLLQLAFTRMQKDGMPMPPPPIFPLSSQALSHLPLVVNDQAPATPLLPPTGPAEYRRNMPSRTQDIQQEQSRMEEVSGRDIEEGELSDSPVDKVLLNAPRGPSSKQKPNTVPMKTLRRERREMKKQARGSRAPPKKNTAPRPSSHVPRLTSPEFPRVSRSAQGADHYQPDPATHLSHKRRRSPSPSHRHAESAKRLRMSNQTETNKPPKSEPVRHSGVQLPSPQDTNGRVLEDFSRLRRNEALDFLSAVYNDGIPFSDIADYVTDPRLLEELWVEAGLPKPAQAMSSPVTEVSTFKAKPETSTALTNETKLASPTAPVAPPAFNGTASTDSTVKPNPPASNGPSKNTVQSDLVVSRMPTSQGLAIRTAAKSARAPRAFVAVKTAEVTEARTTYLERLHAVRGKPDGATTSGSPKVKSHPPVVVKTQPDVRVANTSTNHGEIDAAMTLSEGTPSAAERKKAKTELARKKTEQLIAKQSLKSGSRTTVESMQSVASQKEPQTALPLTTVQGTVRAAAPRATASALMVRVVGIVEDPSLYDEPEAATEGVAHNIGPASSVSPSVMGMQTAKLHQQECPEPSAQPQITTSLPLAPSLSLGGIPGLFMTASTPKPAVFSESEPKSRSQPSQSVGEQLESATNFAGKVNIGAQSDEIRPGRPTPPVTVGPPTEPTVPDRSVQSRLQTPKASKLPVAADFADTQAAKVSRPFGLPFGHSTFDDDAMIIEVSDDETVDGAEDCDPIGSGGETASESLTSARQIATRETRSLRDSPGHSILPKPSVAPSSSTPSLPGTPGATKDTAEAMRLRQEILKMKLKIAEKERYKVAKTKGKSSRVQTPVQSSAIVGLLRKHDHTPSATTVDSVATEEATSALSRALESETTWTPSATRQLIPLAQRVVSVHSASTDPLPPVVNAWSGKAQVTSTQRRFGNQTPLSTGDSEKLTVERDGYKATLAEHSTLIEDPELDYVNTERSTLEEPPANGGGIVQSNGEAHVTAFDSQADQSSRSFAPTPSGSAKPGSPLEIGDVSEEGEIHEPPQPSAPRSGEAKRIFSDSNIAIVKTSDSLPAQRLIVNLDGDIGNMYTPDPIERANTVISITSSTDSEDEIPATVSRMAGSQGSRLPTPVRSQRAQPTEVLDAVLSDYSASELELLRDSDGIHVSGSVTAPALPTDFRPERNLVSTKTTADPIAKDLSIKLWPRSGSHGWAEKIPKPAPAAPAIHGDYFQPYRSPLSQFKAYRFHPQYLNTVSGGYRSLTYSHQIDPSRLLCKFECAGGVCNDPTCEGQHFRQMGITDDKMLVQMGSSNPGRDSEEKQKWTTGLKEVVKQLRAQNLKDPEIVAQRIVEYRRNFLQDPSRVLNL